MARAKNRNHNGPGLFDEQELHLERRIRRQRALFIPKFLRAAAASLKPEGNARERAYELALHWANLETEGHLPKYKDAARLSVKAAAPMFFGRQSQRLRF
jgi:hypothetical protein